MLPAFFVSRNNDSLHANKAFGLESHPLGGAG